LSDRSHGNPRDEQVVSSRSNMPQQGIRPRMQRNQNRGTPRSLRREHHNGNRIPQLSNARYHIAQSASAIHQPYRSPPLGASQPVYQIHYRTVGRPCAIGLCGVSTNRAGRTRTGAARATSRRRRGLVLGADTALWERWSIVLCSGDFRRADRPPAPQETCPPLDVVYADYAKMVLGNQKEPWQS
jgi:hypothetical protein